MKKTHFFKKKLKNFLKNSINRNLIGSLKYPSDAQKKPALDTLTCSHAFFFAYSCRRPGPDFVA